MEISSKMLVELEGAPVTFGETPVKNYPEALRALRDRLMSRGKKLSPHCLEAIFDSQLPSPKLSLKMPPKLSLPHKRGLLILFQKLPPR